jgi:hypothetical protein
VDSFLSFKMNLGVPKLMMQLKSVWKNGNQKALNIPEICLIVSIAFFAQHFVL